MNIVTKTQVGTGSSDPIVLDYRLQNGVRVAVETSGTTNYTVQHTNDDIFNTPASSLVWFDYPGTSLAAATTNGDGAYQQTPTGLRVKNNTGAGTTKIIVIEQGRIG